MKISPRLASSAALALLFGWLVAWRPLSWPGPVEHGALDLTASAQGGGRVTVRLDEGHGYDEGANERIRRLQADGAPATIAIPLPPMRLRGFKLEVTGARSLTLKSVRLVFSGKTLADCLGGLYLDASTVAESRPEGITLRPMSEGGVIGAEYQPSTPLLLPAGDEPWLIEQLAYFVLLTTLFAFVQTAAVRWVVSPSGARCRRVASALRQAVRARPTLALAAVGLSASLLSSYPVAFCGRSFVSPNSFPCLLYDFQRPTIPGIAREPVKDAKSSDLAAMMLYHLPSSALEHDALFRDHEPPLWNRFDSGGIPLLGQGQSMFGDPLHFLAILTDGASWAWDLKFLLAKALFCFGIGLCVRALTGRVGVAALVGASAAWIGFFAYRFNHAAFFSLCYSPWVLLPWLWLRASSARSPRALCLVAAGLIIADGCELLSGTAKEASMLLVCLNAAGLLVAVVASPDWKERRRAVAAPLIASGLFLLLSAPHWLVFLDALRQAKTIYDAPAVFQLQPGLLVGFFDDIFSQDFTPYEVHTHVSVNFLALAGLLWLAASRRRDPTDRSAAALTWVAAGLAALVFGVIPPAWIKVTPFLGQIFRIENTFGCPLIVIALLLAGIGLAKCLSEAALPDWSQTYRRSIIGLALVMALYLGFTQAVPVPPHSFSILPPWHSVFFSIYAPLLLAAAALIPWALRWTQCAGEWRLAGYLIAGALLVLLHFRHGMYIQTRFDDYVMTPRLRADLVARSPSLEDLRRLLDEPARTAGFDLTLAPGYSALLGLENLGGPDALFNRYYREYTDAAKISRYTDWWVPIYQTELPRLKPIYDALNLRFYLREPRPGLTPPAGLAPAGGSDLEIFESKEVWPRAFFTDYLLRYRTPAELVAVTVHGDGRPFAAVQEPSLAPVAVAASYSDRKIVRAANYRHTTNVTEFTVEAPGPGVIVLGENFEAGNFRVTLNGAPVSYFRVNHAFKGVSVDQAGAYRVRFSYWPRLLTPALWISAAGAALTLLCASVCLRRGSPKWELKHSVA